VIKLLEGIEEYLKVKDLPVPSGREREAIIHALTGMTQSEIVNVLKKSVAKNRKIELAEIVAEKEQVIRKTGLLEYITKLGDMSNVGGMDLLKEWAADAYYAFDPEARNYNVDPVRGMVLTGPPGTGKSLSAKAIAFDWNLPLLKMNMGDIMDSRVGQSEKNIARALKLAEAVSPCVLWMDEFEKGLSGLGSSDKSDAGTMSRVIQEILTWLSEKTAPVFVVATANDVTKLPPELTRAGRFDAVMFVSLPHEEERVEILGIHLKKRGYIVVEDPDLVTADNMFSITDLKELAATMKDFSGAEIEQVVAEAGRRAYAAFRKGQREHHYITLADLKEQIKNVVPLAKRDPNLMAELRRWAKQSAKCASSKEHAFLHGEYKEESKSRLRVVPDIEFND
jgi:SpoVK/Ycf46/Vps4 family AAA+-type ATPase